MMKIVNGYVCTSGCDVAVAKKGKDPKNPHDDPVKQAQLGAKNPAKAAKIEARKRLDASLSDDAVSYGGRLAGLIGAQATGSTPAAAPSVGAVLDVLA